MGRMKMKVKELVKPEAKYCSKKRAIHKDQLEWQSIMLFVWTLSQLICKKA